MLTNGVTSDTRILKKARVAVHKGVPTITYWSEYWVLQKKDESKLDAI